MIMATKPTGNRIIDFNAEGVTFIFPPELDYVFVHRLPVPDLAGQEENDSGNFKPKRVFANFKLYEKTSETTNRAITEFESPFKIEIHYKQEDDDNANRQDKQKVCAYLPKKASEWIPFTAKEHRFEPKPYNPSDANYEKKKKAGFEGFGVVTIEKEWPDPAMGWGP
jgi:hypothetical protein